MNRRFNLILEIVQNSMNSARNSSPYSVPVPDTVYRTPSGEDIVLGKNNKPEPWYMKFEPAPKSNITPPRPPRDRYIDPTPRPFRPRLRGDPPPSPPSHFPMPRLDPVTPIDPKDIDPEKFIRPYTSSQEPPLRLPMSRMFQPILDMMDRLRQERPQPYYRGTSSNSVTPDKILGGLRSRAGY